MNRRTSTKLIRLVRIRCDVSRADIDAMLDDYESGMADATTSNAISRSVRRLLGIEEPVVLERGHGNGGELKVRDHRIPIEVEITEWLTRVETGYLPKPISFELLIPEFLFEKGVLANEMMVKAMDAQARTTAA